MSQAYHSILCYLLLIFFINSVHPLSKGRNNFRVRTRARSSASASASGSSSWENDYNPNDRSIGNNVGKAGASKGAASKYSFYVTPDPSYTQSPVMFKRLEAKGYNEIDDVDKDYYAHYDFEFAKSGTNHANFQQKYLNHQASHIGKPLVTGGASTGDESLGAFAPKDSKPTDKKGLLGGLGI